MERLDKILSCALGFSRTEIKKIIKSGRISVDGEVLLSAEKRIDENKIRITFDGKEVKYKKYIYLMLNKPKGVVSASVGHGEKTVIDLVPDNLKRDGLFPAGRLDSDTTGFVLITDDGDFAHRILSPKNHVEKNYEALLQRPLTDEDIFAFKKGVKLKDGTLCLEAKLRPLQGENRAEIIIHEGKYHQVKRMFAALGNSVVELKRVKIGGLSLDEKLGEGQCREITEKEFEMITK